jgi:hypothetical protein
MLPTTPIDPDDSGREQWFVAAAILQPPRRCIQRSAHNGLSHSAAAVGSPSAHLWAVVRSRCGNGKFPQLFDAILKDAGIEVVLSGVQMPRMNAITERWVQTCRRELLDRTSTWVRQLQALGYQVTLASAA